MVSLFPLLLLSGIKSMGDINIKGKWEPLGKTCLLYTSTWDQITEMSQSGLVEFGNHTYNLHKSDGARLGAKKLAGENADSYKQMLMEDVHEIQDKLTAATNKAPLCFAYPFGAVSKDTPEIIKSMGFSITLTCESHMNTVTRDPESLFDLGRFLRTQDQSVEKILTK